MLLEWLIAEGKSAGSKDRQRVSPAQYNHIHNEDEIGFGEDMRYPYEYSNV